MHVRGVECRDNTHVSLSHATIYVACCHTGTRTIAIAIAIAIVIALDYWSWLLFVLSRSGKGNPLGFLGPPVTSKGVPTVAKPENFSEILLLGTPVVFSNANGGLWITKEWNAGKPYQNGRGELENNGLDRERYRILQTIHNKPKLR